MRNHIVLFLAMLLMPFVSLSQSKRPQVLVYGDGIDAVTAAIQSAKSKLNTVWIMEGNHLNELTFNQFNGKKIESHARIHGGIWAALVGQSRSQIKLTDSLLSATLNPLNTQLLLNAIDLEIKKYPHLTIVYNGKLTTIKQRKNDWEVSIDNKQTFTVWSIVDASPEGKLGGLAQIEHAKYFAQQTEPTSDTTAPDTFSTNTFSNNKLRNVRTAIFSYQHPNGTYQSLPLASLMQHFPADKNGKEIGLNIFYTRHEVAVQDLLTHSENDLPLLAHLGQSVGAIAAYMAFFKITSERAEVRQIQGELLQYGARILPFEDILVEDPNFYAIQRIGLTGLFSPSTNDQTAFLPDEIVHLAELQSTLEPLYSRSQIWFAEHKQLDTLNVNDVLSLIKYISQRGNELNAVVERNWHRKFNFTSTFDLTKKISRREAAVILDEYSRPFDVRIDLKGNITR
jgi:hypothetical protein